MPPRRPPDWRATLRANSRRSTNNRCTSGTAFQRHTWQTLRTVRAGETLSYAGLAERIGTPTAVRAVAAANGANILALFIPCHRVIAANGTLWGYGGGLPMKAWLLRHEGARFTALPAQEQLSL